MKVLWVSNSPIGPASTILGEEYKGSSGGWIQTEYEALDKENIEMYFLCTSRCVNRGKIIHKSNEIGHVYCLKAPRLSYGIKNPRYLMKNVQDVINEIKPDVIQIWGTETCLSNIISLSKTSAPKIIYIQGIIGVHKRYIGGYFGNLQEERKYMRGVGLVAKLKDKMRRFLFLRQSKIEYETIKNCNNVIIDHEFAKSYCNSVSQNIHCFWHVLYPNKKFNNYKWNYNDCEKHSIFTVYGSSTEKGIQQLLKAVKILKSKYKDIQIVIPGPFHLDKYGKLAPSRFQSFETILKNMITNLGLENNVKFTGRIDIEGMAKKISLANVFVNPSCMETQALSLREAMMVGTPCISSLCGCVPEYLNHKETGYIYRFEEYEMLALYIDKTFSQSEKNKCNQIDFSSCIPKYALQKNMAFDKIYNKLLIKK